MRDGGRYAGGHIIVANRRRMAAVYVGSIVVAVAVGSSGGSFGDVHACVGGVPYFLQLFRVW